MTQTICSHCKNQKKHRGIWIIKATIKKDAKQLRYVWGYQGVCIVLHWKFVHWLIWKSTREMRNERVSRKTLFLLLDFYQLKNMLIYRNSSYRRCLLVRQKASNLWHEFLTVSLCILEGLHMRNFGHCWVQHGLNFNVDDGVSSHCVYMKKAELNLNTGWTQSGFLAEILTLWDRLKECHVKHSPCRVQRGQIFLMERVSQWIGFISKISNNNL